MIGLATNPVPRDARLPVPPTPAINSQIVTAPRDTKYLSLFYRVCPVLTIPETTSICGQNHRPLPVFGPVHYLLRIMNSSSPCPRNNSPSSCSCTESSITLNHEQSYTHNISSSTNSRTRFPSNLPSRSEKKQ